MVHMNLPKCSPCPTAKQIKKENQEREKKIKDCINFLIDTFGQANHIQVTVGELTGYLIRLTGHLK